MPKQITNITKERLKEAVSDMVILVDEGDHPTSALVKVAKDLKLTDDQTRLVGRAYNTAHTADVREKGASILEKLATTPIADCEKAVTQLHTEKTASCDEIAPIYLTDRKLDPLRGLTTKVAEERQFHEWVKTASPVKPEIQQEHSLKKLLSDIDHLTEAQSKLAGQIDVLKNKFNASVQILEKYAAKSPDEVRLATKLAAVNHFGRAILPYIDKAMPVYEATCKLASADHTLLSVVGDIQTLGEELKQALYLMNKVAQCRAKVEESIKKKVGIEKQAVISPTLDSLFVKSLMLDKVFPRDTDKTPTPGNEPPSRFVQHGIVTPDHKRNIDNIRMKSMVNDMLSNDDIISQYDPDEVYRIINDLKATAPEVMNRPMAARSFVRESLSKGTLGTFDLTPLMGYEKGLSNQQQ